MLFIMHYCINKFFIKMFTVILLLYLIFAAVKVKIKLPSHFCPNSIGWIGLKQLDQQFLTIYACQIFRFSKTLFLLKFLLLNEKLSTAGWTFWSFDIHDGLVEGYISCIISEGPIKIVCWTMRLHELPCHRV